MTEVPNSQSSASENNTKQFVEGIMSQTTRKIAFLLLVFYGVCMVTILIAAIYFYYNSPAGEKPDDRWLNIFKDTFAFLSGLLATIIGYYFGNRNVGEALEKARREEAKAGKATERADRQEAKAGEAIEIAKQQEAKAEAFKNEIVGGSAGDDPIIAETSPTIDETVLDSPKNDN